MAENWFGRQAEQYKAARPSYPPELFDYLQKFAPDAKTVLDVGCGSGQATKLLAARFNRVVGLDESTKQLAAAAKSVPENVRLIRALSSDIPLADKSVDLVTAATALHWFDLPKFYAEATRVLKDDGKLAAWVYYIAKVNDEINRVTNYFFEDRLAHHIDESRQWIIDRYDTIPFPFGDKCKKHFEYSAEADFSRFLSLIRSSSFVQKEIENTGKDPVLEIEDDLKRLWGDHETRTLSWDVSLISGSKAAYSPCG